MPTKQPETTLHRAISIAKERERVELEEAKAHRAQALKHYLGILLRADKPADEDATTLANVMLDLGITVDQLQADRNLIISARKWETRWDAREAAAQRYREATAAYKAMKDRHKAEEKEAARARFAAERDHSLAFSHAPNELYRLPRRRPELFDCSTHPPRLLRGSTPETKRKR